MRLDILVRSKVFTLDDITFRPSNEHIRSLFKKFFSQEPTAINYFEYNPKDGLFLPYKNIIPFESYSSGLLLAFRHSPEELYGLGILANFGGAMIGPIEGDRSILLKQFIDQLFKEFDPDTENKPLGLGNEIDSSVYDIYLCIRSYISNGKLY